MLNKSLSEIKKMDENKGDIKQTKNWLKIN